jgi:hypothetical protein
MMTLSKQLTAAATLVFGVLLSTNAASLRADEPAEKPGKEPMPVKQIRGGDLGGTAGAVYVARDKATWDAVKKAVGDRHELPRGSKQGESLDSLDDTDFQQDMIVAVFWGEMNFSGHNEKCWIESVDVGDRQVSVACRANLWGGNVLRSYRAWPYVARVVRRSDLPVVFVQDTQYEANPAASEKNKVLATLKPDDWKQEIAPPR